MTIKVRIAKSTDFPFCRKVEYKHTPDQWLHQAIQNEWFYLAELENKPVAYARLEFIWFCKPYLALLSVEDDFQRQGIGRKLLTFIAKDLKRKGYTQLFSSTEHTALNAQLFHKAVGFTECGIIVGINENGLSEIFLEKSLE
jgi:GNAT superfamily N-acetyltransferase